MIGAPAVNRYLSSKTVFDERTSTMTLRINVATICVATFLVGSSAIASTKYAKVGGATTGNCDSWTNACTMDRAISLASSGDSVWAKKTAGGSPYGPLDLKNGVKIIGGFAGTETLASQSNPTTNVTTIDGGDVEQCVFSDANGTSTILRGFRLSNCSNGDSSDWDGGGALVLSNSDAVFANCIFEENTSVRFGAAVAIKGTGSPKFFNCIFRNNGSGTSGSAEDEDVEPMAGGAVYLHSGSPSFTNCLFYGNKAGEGAVIAIANGTATFTNCTVADNYCKYAYGGGLNDAGGRATLRNCILWGNTAIKGGNQIFNYASKNSLTTYTNVQGGYTGTGNINSDPVFVNASAGDYSLQSSTPCDNVGNGTMPDDLGDLDWDTITSEPVPLDLAGNIRAVFAIDMGAYEVQPGPD